MKYPTGVYLIDHDGKEYAFLYKDEWSESKLKYLQTNYNPKFITVTAQKTNTLTLVIPAGVITGERI